MWIRLGDTHLKTIVKHTDMIHKWGIINEAMKTTKDIHDAVNGKWYHVEIKNNIVDDIKRQLMWIN